MLFRNSMGLRVVEIAKACGVDRRTIYRDLAALEQTGVPISQQEGRFFINREYYQANVRLNLNEALALFLAGRVLSRQSNQQNPHVISALSRLAAALPEPLASHVNAIAESMRSAPVDPSFIDVLETITRAWFERRKIRLWCSETRNGDIQARDFATYFIEPTLNTGLYVVGYDELNESVRAFRLEWVKRAKLLDSMYTLPSQFDRRRFLANAWGIPGEGDGITRVVLAFSADLTPLIKERIWHSSQRIETLPDKRCTLSVAIADWRELLPWIRSWGAQVEVLEPQALRQELAADAARVAAVYNGAVAG
jgi:predicted DNA-binding transcriptional regulator YafY